MKKSLIISLSLLFSFHLASFIQCQQSYYGSPQLSQLKIGALFDDDDLEDEVILKQAVEQINKDPTILPHHHLTVISETIPSDNSFFVSKHVCNLLSEGIVGIFGPQDAELASHAQALCDRYDIPHIETQWDYRTWQDKYAINLFPHPDTLGQAFSNLIERYQWKRFAILYDTSDENIFKLQGLVKSSKQQILLRRLPIGNNYRPLLKQLQRKYDVNKILIDCGMSKTLEILKQAQEVGMIRFDYHYILTTLDIQPWDLDDFRHGDANFTALRIVNPENSEVRSIVVGLDTLTNPDHRRYEVSQRKFTGKPRGILTSEALIYDGIKLISKALHNNIETVRAVRPIDCSREDAWTEGASIINAMRSMEPFPGLTGIIQFNNSGYRTDVILEVISLREEGLTKIGIWDYARASASDRFTWMEPLLSKEKNETDELPVWNRTMRVVTIMTNPLCMHALSEVPLSGNERYIGFSVDLVKELSQEMGFKYKIRLVEDGTHDGMITEILESKGDMVVADLTVTTDRQKQLDFTMPFMNLGISILFTQPQAKPPSLFSFMSPFAWEVWIYIAVAFLSVSFILFLVARITPYEWDSPLPCIANPEKLYNQFNLANSFWFTIGSILQQGSDLAPKAVSTRIIAGTWWFFTLIMVSSYTANLATFLIVQELEESFKNLEELANSKIDYGCVANGSTSKFFSSSQNPVKQRIWENMKRKGEIVLKTSNDEGINSVRARPGKFAFFMESTIIEYHMERKCGITQVGGLLDHKGYGIALPKDSPYLDFFNSKILKMQENGKLDELKRKWWKEEGKEASETCPTTSVSDSVKALSLSNVGGVFVVLVFGCIVAIIITATEFFFKIRKLKTKGSLKEEIIKDLQFALQCRGNVKPVKKEKTTEGVVTEDELGSTPYLNNFVSSLNEAVESSSGSGG